MKWIVGDEMGVKASGGIRTFEDAVKMIMYGADRIGTSSGVKIVQGRREIWRLNAFRSKNSAIWLQRESQLLVGSGWISRGSHGMCPR